MLNSKTQQLESAYEKADQTCNEMREQMKEQKNDEELALENQEMKEQAE